MPIREIITMTCENIEKRILYTQILKKTNLVNIGVNEYIFTIPGESHTIGNLLVKTITELYPELMAITYTESNTERKCTIRIKCIEDIESVLDTTIQYLLDVYTQIKTYF